ncbi:MAG: acyl-CoA thioesterase [Polyangiales bacterium]
MSNALGRWPIRVELRVAWGDMDAFRHVNNTVFLRWFESARIAYFERVGLVDYDRVGPILARATIQFRRPVTYPDTVAVEASITRLGTTSFEMQYRATSRSQNVAIVAEGDSTIVMFDYSAGSKVALSASLRAAIEALEATGVG